MNEEQRVEDQRMLEEDQILEDLTIGVEQNATIVSEENIVFGWFNIWRKAHQDPEI